MLSDDQLTLLVRSREPGLVYATGATLDDVLPPCSLLPPSGAIGCYVMRFVRWLEHLFAPAAPPVSTPMPPTPPAGVMSAGDAMSRVRRWMGGKVEPEDVCAAAMQATATSGWGAWDPPRPATLGEIHSMAGALARVGEIHDLGRGTRHADHMSGADDTYDPRVAAARARWDALRRMLDAQVRR
jgi:hypothetical protein